MKGHFGPINTIAIHPDGKRFVSLHPLLSHFQLFPSFSYASGGEDGLIRVHYFDNDYLEYDIAY